MARSRGRKSGKEKSEKDKIGGLLFVASLFTGFGLGFIFNNPPAGLFMGLGAGFGLMAFMRLQERDKHLAQEPLPEDEYEYDHEDVTLRQQNPNLYDEISYEDFRSGKDLE